MLSLLTETQTSEAQPDSLKVSSSPSLSTCTKVRAPPPGAEVTVTVCPLQTC